MGKKKELARAAPARKALAIFSKETLPGVEVFYLSGALRAIARCALTSGNFYYLSCAVGGSYYRAHLNCFYSV